MNIIPYPFVHDINYGAKQIGKKYHAQSQIIAAGNKINKYSVRNQNNKPEGDCLDDRPVEMFIKPSGHKYIIADEVGLG